MTSSMESNNIDLSSFNPSKEVLDSLEPFVKTLTDNFKAIAYKTILEEERDGRVCLEFGSILFLPIEGCIGGSLLEIPLPVKASHFDYNEELSTWFFSVHDGNEVSFKSHVVFEVDTGKEGMGPNVKLELLNRMFLGGAYVPYGINSVFELAKKHDLLEELLFQWKGKVIAILEGDTHETRIVSLGEKGITSYEVVKPNNFTGVELDSQQGLNRGCATGFLYEPFLDEEGRFVPIRKLTIEEETILKELSDKGLLFLGQDTGVKEWDLRE